MISEEQLKEKILGRMDLSREVEDEELQELIFRVLEEESRGEYISLGMRAKLGKELFNAFRKLDLLQELIEDEDITEVMINGVQNIFVEKQGKLYLTDRHFLSREKLEDVIQQIVAGTNRLVNEATPIVDTRLPDGSRVNVVLYPVALNGPIVTIRKFPKERITMGRLVALGALSEELAEVLKKLVAAGYNIFISGGTGSGKTTMLNALSQYIPKDERIITIEDNAELQISDVPNLVRLEARNANVEGVGEITIRDLIRSALRMRPNRVIVGEVRGPETIDMLQAMSTGHKGSLSTGHSDSPRDMLRRLETMVLMGMDIPLAAIQRQIASAIDIIIHIGRLWDKSRKVLEVVEVLDYNGEEIDTRVLYRFEETGKRGERVIGEWRKVQDLANKAKLLSAGYQTL
ncbi:MAG: CpaF family protein [Dorea sp.]|nr:CpaF family protein [Dorea sp.]